MGPPRRQAKAGARAVRIVRIGWLVLAGSFSVLVFMNPEDAFFNILFAALYAGIGSHTRLDA